MVAELALGIAVAFVASVIACRAIIAAGLWDKPMLARQAHQAPTPTSGGVGVAIGFALGLLALVMAETLHLVQSEAHDLSRLMAEAGFAYLFMLVGFFDDLRPLGARSKFLLFAALSVGAAYYVGGVDTLPLAEGMTLELGFALGLIGSALWIFTLVNCVNFMDGSNGLAMGSVAIGLAGLAAIAFSIGAPIAAAFALCGVGALLGLLVWNFPLGRLFAGNSGALFAGALAALASLAVIAEGGLSPFAPAILFLPLLADALLTLAWRFGRRRNLLDGHSEHLYQIAIRAGFSHARAALCYWVATAVCWAIAFGAVRSGELAAPPLALLLLALAAILISAQVRAYALTRGIAEE